MSQGMSPGDMAQGTFSPLSQGSGYALEGPQTGPLSAGSKGQTPILAQVRGSGAGVRGGGRGWCPACSCQSSATVTRCDSTQRPCPLPDGPGPHLRNGHIAGRGWALDVEGAVLTTPAPLTLPLAVSPRPPALRARAAAGWCGLSQLPPCPGEAHGLGEISPVHSCL